MMFQGSSKGLSREFEVGFKGILNSSKIILRMFQRCFKWVSRKIEGCSYEELISMGV